MITVSLTSIHWDFTSETRQTSLWETDDPRTLKDIIRVARKLAEREVKRAVAECPANLPDSFFGGHGPIIRIYTPTRNWHHENGPVFIARFKDGWFLSTNDGYRVLS